MSSSSTKLEKIDVQFKDISYSCKPHIFAREKVQILKSVNGEFKSGELSAIIGPSGCGKTTLLNILTGYVTLNFKGQLLENGFERNEEFHTKICYLMQDEKLQQLLTIKEALMYAAELKLSSKISKKEKENKVDEILKSLGIYDCRNTRTQNASGGQRKRLSIALELLHNPPVMFFDEPTSGLDTYVSKQLVKLLQNLAQEGRTVICTIHQPSSTLLQMFDHLYTLVDGKCVYQGSVDKLLPYLENFDPPLKCPKFHNPADYLLEVGKGEHGDYMDALVDKCGNGKVSIWRKNGNRMLAIEEDFDLEQNSTKDQRHLSNEWKNLLSKSDTNEKFNKETAICDDKSTNLEGTSQDLTDPHKFGGKVSLEPNTSTVNFTTSNSASTANQFSMSTDETSNIKKNESSNVTMLDAQIFATSYWHQVCVLIRRCYVIMSRDRQLTYTRFGLHILTSIFAGILYFGIGNDAKFTRDNFGYVFFTTMFNMYTSFSSMLVAFADDVPIVTKEYFNRWYSVKSYYTAVTIVDLPIQFIVTFIFLIISYIMTDQPRDAFRIWLFFSMCYLVALVAQSCGMFVSASLKLQNGIIFGPVALMPFIAFCGYFILMKDAPWFLHWLFHASYLRYAIEGAVHALLGYNRGKLECSADYCHYINPEMYMKEIGMGEPRILVDYAVLFGYYVFVKLATYLALTIKIGGKR